MSEIIPYSEIKTALDLPEKCRLSTVEKELRKRKLPFEYGRKGVFALRSVWHDHMTGKSIAKPEHSEIDF